MSLLALQATPGANGNLEPPAADTSTPPVSAAAQKLVDAAAVQRAEADRQSAELNQQKAAALLQQQVFDQQASASKAKSAAIAAQIDASKAPFAGVQGQTDIKGVVTISKDEAAKGEGMLLVARASEAAAQSLTQSLSKYLVCPMGKDCPPQSILVLTDANQLSVADVIQFDFNYAIVAARIKAAKAHLLEVKNVQAQVSVEGQRRSAVAAAGAAIEAAAKIVSYFQTDYTFGIVSPNEPTNLTTSVVAGALRKVFTGGVIVPGNIVPSDAAGVTTEITQLALDYDEVVTLQASSLRRALAVKAADPGLAAQLDAADADAAKAIASYDAFATSLAVVAGQEAPILRIARARIIQKELAAGAWVLLVQTEKAAGYYTKRNLWTFFGGAPLFTMGGVVSAYSLYDPKTGRTIAAGVAAKHGGYRSVDQVEALFR